MKEQKYAIWVSAGVSLASLLISIILHACRYGQYWSGFWVNVFIGIFGGGILSLLLSISAYRTRRTETLEAFVNEVRKATQALKIVEEDFRELHRDEIHSIIKTIGGYDEWELGRSFASIYFFFFNSKNRKKIFYEIYNPVHEMLKLCETYNRKLQDDDTGIFEYAKIIDEKFYKRYKIGDADVGYITCIDSRIVPVTEALNGWFWDLLYGKDGKETKRDL